MVRGLVGGDDVEACLVERQARRIRGHEDDVGSIACREARQLDLPWIDVDAHHTDAERVGDQQRGGAIAAANVQVRPPAPDRHMAETPHRGLSHTAAVPRVIDKTFFDSRHSQGTSSVVLE